MHDLTASWAAQAGSALGIAEWVSLAEQAMERGGLTGRTIEMPVGHVDDPTYQAAIAPLNEYVRKVTGVPHLRIYYSSYSLMVSGNPIALTDGMNYIIVRKTTNEMTILHECAHVLRSTPEGSGGHDRAFAEVARDLYAKHLSTEAADVFWRNVEWAWTL